MSNAATRYMIYLRCLCPKILQSFRLFRSVVCEKLSRMKKPNPWSYSKIPIFLFEMHYLNVIVKRSWLLKCCVLKQSRETIFFTMTYSIDDTRGYKPDTYCKCLLVFSVRYIGFFNIKYLELNSWYHFSIIWFWAFKFENPNSNAEKMVW